MAGSGGQSGASNLAGMGVAMVSRPGNAVHQQLTRRGDVFAMMAFVVAVDVSPEEIRAIALVTAVGQPDTVDMPGPLPRRDGDDDFHSRLYPN